MAARRSASRARSSSACRRSRTVIESAARSCARRLPSQVAVSHSGSTARFIAPLSFAGYVSRGRLPHQGREDAQLLQPPETVDLRDLEIGAHALFGGLVLVIDFRHARFLRPPPGGRSLAPRY